MKLSLITAALLTILTPAALATPKPAAIADALNSTDSELSPRWISDDWYYCKKKSHAVAQAITRLCAKTDMVVPSDWAGLGKVGGDKGSAFVNIQGPCNPPQWVPKHVCMSQFHYMCRHGNDRGQAEAKYGRNNCQTWVISH